MILAPFAAKSRAQDPLDTPIQYLTSSISLILFSNLEIKSELLELAPLFQLLLCKTSIKALSSISLNCGHFGKGLFRIFWPPNIAKFLI